MSTPTKMLRTAPRALSQTGNSPKCHQVVPILRNLTTTKPVAGRVAPKNSLQGLPAPSSSFGLSCRQYSNSFGLRPPDKKPWNPKDNRFNHEKTSRFTGKVTPQENDNEPDEIIERDHLDDISKDPVPHLLSQEERSHLPEPTHIAPEATSTLEISNLLAVAMRTDIQGWCRSAGLRLLDDRFPPDYPSYCRLRFASVEEAVKAKSFLSEKPIFDGEPAISFFIEKSKSTRFMCIPDFKGTLESLNQAVAQVAEAEVHLVPVEDMGKLRMDAYLKFSSLTDADRAFQYLRRHQFEDGVFAQNIESIEPSRYTAVVSPSDAGRSMSDFVTTPPRRDEDGIGRSAPSVPSGPSTTIWMGNIPLELLEQRAEILDKFSKYGEIHELRIPRAQAGPRGCMWIEYQKQPSADAAYRDLMANPLILYGRPTKVDYAEPRQVREGSQMLRSTNSVCIRGVEPRIAQDRLTLSRMLETFGDVVDIRIRKLPSSKDAGLVFVDFLDADGASRCIESVRKGGLEELLPNISIDYASPQKAPEWAELNSPPTDTLRAWNLPARALVDGSMLREALGGDGTLISVRIPREQGWPWGIAFLHYTSVNAAKNVLDWVLSDLDNPVTFFGRPLRVHFAQNVLSTNKSKEGEDEGWGGSPRHPPQISNGL